MRRSLSYKPISKFSSNNWTGSSASCSGKKSEKRLDLDPVEQGNLLTGLGVEAPPQSDEDAHCTGVLGGAVGGVSNDPNAALLDAQDRERPELPPEVWPGEGQAGTARDLDGRNEGEGRACLRRLARALRRQVPHPATACLARDRDELLAFYDFPAAHWTHLRTTNVIESAFATIRHRSSRAKGCVTRQTMLSMIYKMGRCAEKSWRRLRGFRQLAKVIEGVKFNDGIERRPSVPSTTGSSATTTSTPRPPPAWLATATNCSRSTTSRCPLDASSNDQRLIEDSKAAA